MKGVHPILSHSVLLVIGLFAMGMIIASMSSSLSKTERNLVTAEADYISEALRLRILEIYSTVSQGGNFSGTFGLELPEKIGDQRYTILLDNDIITIELPFENEMIEVNKTINIGVALGGEKMLPASLVVEKTGETITMDLV
ncbi:MAG: hypothetical protein V1818_00050 [Candidatus Aenigmatarchaeota archaeon]